MAEGVLHSSGILVVAFAVVDLILCSRVSDMWLHAYREFKYHNKKSKSTELYTQAFPVLFYTCLNAQTWQ